MLEITEKRYNCRTCRQQVLVQFETQQAIVANPKACTRQCAFAPMIVGAKDVIDREILNISRSCKKCSYFKDSSQDKDIAIANEC